MFTHMNHANKVSETATHVFFLNQPFSQWTPSIFTEVLLGEERTFNCAEQYMMASKAAVFEDYRIFEEIMKVEQERSWQAAPKRCKELGRQITPFDEDKWNNVAQEIVLQGNLAKFTQNPDMAAILLATGDKELVEGAHYDKIWGVGLAWDDPRIIDPKNWRGTNWLGRVLMRVRDTLNGF